MTPSYSEIEVLRKLEKEDREIFTLLEHQLGVCDRKAIALISLDGILLVLIAQRVVTHWIATIGTICLLVSAFFSLMALQVKWATKLIKFFNESPKFDELLKFRKTKTRWVIGGMLWLICGLTCVASYSIYTYFF